jgi:hypothetical protein
MNACGDGAVILLVFDLQAARRSARASGADPSFPVCFDELVPGTSSILCFAKRQAHRAHSETRYSRSSRQASTRDDRRLCGEMRGIGGNCDAGKEAVAMQNMKTQ